MPFVSRTLTEMVELLISPPPEGGVVVNSISCIKSKTPTLRLPLGGIAKYVEGGSTWKAIALLYGTFTKTTVLERVCCVWPFAFTLHNVLTGRFNSENEIFGSFLNIAETLAVVALPGIVVEPANVEG